MLVDPTFWQNFWPGFWGNLLADFIVGIIITGLISWVIRKSKKIEAKILVQIFREDDNTLSFTFLLRNTGKVSFKTNEIIWNVLIQQPFINVNNFTAAMVRTNPEIELIRDNLEINKKNHVLYNNLFDKPLFPGRQAELFRIDVIPVTDKFELYYFLSTAYGYFPETLELDQEGAPFLTSIVNVGKIEIMK